MLDLSHSRRLKDIGDRTLAIVGLIATAPVFASIALALKIRKEKVFFLQDRVGLNQKPFKIFKFTTMVEGSEKSGSITTASDSRVTSLGRFLRQSKINEIPQLINIIKGEMSFVGPRPLTLSEVEEYYSAEDRRKIYSVKPGITGCGSIEFSDEEKLLDGMNDVPEFFAKVIMPKKAELETWYVDNWSIALDLKLFFKTLSKLISNTSNHRAVGGRIEGEIHQE